MSDDNNKFKNGKIYTIRNRNDDTLIYVGATIQPLYKSLSQHKKQSKSIRCAKSLMPLYIKMNELDINDFYIELFEDFPCERKEQLNKREGEIIRQIANLNIRIEGRTNKEYAEDNKEHMQEQRKDYYENNKNLFLRQRKEFYLNNKQKILKLMKEKNENNKEKISEQKKEYYLKKKLEKEEANIITIS